MGRAVVQVSAELIESVFLKPGRHVLIGPDGRARVYDIQCPDGLDISGAVYDIVGRRFTLVVESDKLEAAEEGKMLPVITPTVVSVPLSQG